tara:strand:- start:317 stop:1249 length:933 start_codon:yes stop_codon:yes gene_type:complete
MTKSKQLSPTDRGFETGIVTFLDILGYREILRTRDTSDIVEIVGKLREFGKGDGDEVNPPRRMKEARLYSQAFSESVSDAIVRVRTVETQQRTGAFVFELIDLTHAMIECVASGILLRGGMTIGPVHIGLDGKGPIFGEAMVRAYEIEEREAIYPRIMIDEALVDAYLHDPFLWQDGAFDAYEARSTINYIAMSDDGSYFLDYLRAAGPGEFDDGVAGQFEFLRRHKSLIVKGLDIETLSVRRKYVWLASYHNRFVEQLASRYDLDDPKGKFRAELGLCPREMFDALAIEPTWASALERLKYLGGEDDDV